MEIDSPNVLKISTNIAAQKQSAPTRLEEANHKSAGVYTETMKPLASVATTIYHRRQIEGSERARIVATSLECEW